MSAFIVHKRHIDAILTYAKENCPDALDTFSSISAAGQCLWNENHYNVNYLAQPNTPTPQYEFTPYNPIPSAAQTLKALHCLYEQCCDLEQPEPHSTFQTLYDNIHAEACRNVIGYEEAQWEITE